MTLKKIKTISKVFYIASLLFMILVVIRLVIRIIAVDFALPCTVGLRHYVSQRVKVEAMSNVFTMLGIVNFSLSYIIAARRRTVLGVPLSPIMSELFSWHGVAYINYGGLVLCGIYCGRMGYLLTGVTCFFGAVSALISTGIVAYVFAFNPQRTSECIEDYLKNPPKNHVKERVLVAGNYIRLRYLSSQDVSKELLLRVVHNMCEGLHNPPSKLTIPKFFLFRSPLSQYRESDAADMNESITGRDCQSSDDEKLELFMLTMGDAVVFARVLCHNILGGLSFVSRAELLHIALLLLANNVDTSHMETKSTEKLLENETTRNTIIFLCGIVACLRSDADAHDNMNAAISSKLENVWNGVFNYLTWAGLHSASDVQYDVKKDSFRIMLQLMGILMINAALVEISVLHNSGCDSTRLLELLKTTMSMLNIGEKDVLDFFVLGQAIMSSAGVPSYNPAVKNITSFDYLDWLKRMHIFR